MPSPSHRRRTIKIIIVIGLSMLLVCVCAGFTIVSLTRSFFDTDPTIAAFMDAGIRNKPDAVHSMLSSQHTMSNQTIEHLFGQRELFEGFVSVGKFRGLKIFNYKLENMHIAVKGDLTYTAGKRGHYSADLVYQQSEWKIKSIHVALYDEE